MITGIETAGLILAIFPLIISTLEHYRSCSEKARAVCHYESEIRSLKSILRSYQVRYENSLELLLETVLQPEDISVLLLRPGGQEWKTSKFGEKLSTYLGRSSPVFEDTVSDINVTLKDYATSLEASNPEKVGVPLHLNARHPA